MTSKDYLGIRLREIDLVLGCYDSKLDDASEKTLDKLIEKAAYGAGDVKVRINRKAFIVEVFIVDLEICEADFNVCTKEEYIRQYGEEGEERWKEL